jgi:hypothetical protein
MFTNSLLGSTDVEQLSFIFNILGTPTDENWPDAKKLPGYIEFEPREPMILSTTSMRQSYQSVIERFPNEFEYLAKMLILNPLNRLSANQVNITARTLLHSFDIIASLQCLLDEYFAKSPKACELSELQLRSSSQST